MDDKNVTQFQDLGDMAQKIRLVEEAGPSGVEPLIPDDDGSHVDAVRAVRETIDENYGESIERLAGDGQEVVVERLVMPSDDLPYIEYTLVDEVE